MPFSGIGLDGTPFELQVGLCPAHHYEWTALADWIERDAWDARLKVECCSSGLAATLYLFTDPSVVGGHVDEVIAVEPYGSGHIRFTSPVESDADPLDDRTTHVAGDELPRLPDLGRLTIWKPGTTMHAKPLRCRHDRQFAYRAVERMLHKLADSAQSGGGGNTLRITYSQYAAAARSE